MLTKVLKGFGKLNTIPAPPGTALEQPEAMVRAIDEVVALLAQSQAGRAPEPEAEELESSTNVVEHDGGYAEAVVGLLEIFTEAGMSNPAKLVACLEENAIGSPEELYALDEDDAAEVLDLAKDAKVALGDRNKFKALLKTATTLALSSPVLEPEPELEPELEPEAEGQEDAAAQAEADRLEAAAAAREEAERLAAEHAAAATAAAAAAAVELDSIFAAAKAVRTPPHTTPPISS
jgi:hypothetical protein